MKPRFFLATVAVACGLSAILSASEASADQRRIPQPWIDDGRDAQLSFEDEYYRGGYGRGDYGRPRYPGPYGRPYPPPPVWWGAESEEITVWMTCGQGKELLFQRGYYDVKTNNCRGPNYRYTASRGGARFDIRMSASGQINRVRLAD